MKNKLLTDIEKLIKRSIPQEIVSGFEPDPSIRPEPIPNGGNQRKQPGRGQSSGRTPQPSSHNRGQACRRKAASPACAPRRLQRLRAIDDDGRILDFGFWILDFGFWILDSI